MNAIDELIEKWDIQEWATIQGIEGDSRRAIAEFPIVKEFLTDLRALKEKGIEGQAAVVMKDPTNDLPFGYIFLRGNPEAFGKPAILFIEED